MRLGRHITAVLAAVLTVTAGVSLSAQRQGRFLAKEDIILLGLGLRVEPAHQTVPKDIATIVSTFLQSPTQPGAQAPPFAPGAVIKGTLRGPSFAQPMDLETAPNTPFNIPPLGVKGIHTLDNIRLVSGNETIMFGSPESVTIDVIEKLLVTQVISRPLSAAEIREKGIVFDQSNFQAYNFTAAFAVQDTPINITFPILLPRLAGAEGAATSAAELASVDAPPLPSLKTIIPDTLRVQTQIPNLSVVGFALQLELPTGSELLSFPIPGVIVVPGNIGFLNQMFSVMLMVGNVAPAGSNLVVTDLKAEVVLPTGADTVAGSVDDPLRMAQTVSGEAPRVRPLVQPGADGVAGTNDDIQSLAPGESSGAEYLIEGRREGTHVIEMEISGTLNGLPVGPVPVRGRAAGSVLVRNPSFTLTFTHPEVVTAGEAYALDVTITNTSPSPANFVSLNLHAHNISGAALTGSNTREVDSIPPGDSATVSFDLVSKVTGKVTAATLDSDENVAGRFGLKTAVGELGVPLSPDSLILPKEARSLPKPLLDAAVGLLGKAWAVATAPAGALPADVARFSKQIVFDRAVEVSEAGFRVRLHEPVADSAAQLAMDFLGSNLPRLPEISPAANAPFTAIDYAGFDSLRRSSIRGDIFARAVADLLRDDLTSQGVGTFHRQLAEKLSYRPGHLAVLIGSSGGALPVRVSMADGQGRRLGGSAPGGKIIKEIPFGDHLEFRDDAGAAIGQLAIVAAPQPGEFVVRIEPVPGASEAATFDLSVVIPDAAGRLSQVMYQGLTIRSTPAFANGAGAPFTITFANAAGAAAPAAVSVEPIGDPAPRMIGVVQQKDADKISCLPEGPYFFPGRIIAVLFSEEVTAASAQDKLDALDLTRYGVDGNKVVGVALQPGRRIAFLALRDGIGPYVPRSLTVEGVADRSGQAMASQTLAIESTVTAPGGVVSGQVIEADGTPVAANARLFFHIPCAVGISAKNTGGDGRFSWDYVLGDPVSASITGVSLQAETHRTARFTVQRDGQRLNVNIVLLGRGTFQGRTLAEDGAPLANTKVRVTSLTDQSQYGATTDDNGAFTIGGIPVGNVFVEAVNVARHAQVNLSEHIPVAGGTTVKDIVLLDIDTTRVTVKFGALSGHVLRGDGATPVAGVPVIVYYTNNSQPGVKCPPLKFEQATGKLNECPIAIGTTDDAGAFTFAEISAGALRVETFDQATLQQGDAGVVLAADGKASVTVLLGAGLGTVNGIVLDAGGQPVEGARVGGGLSLTTTDAAGQFVLRDVPVGRREIVAVSDRLAATTKVAIDIVRAGEEVNATLRFPGQGSIAGTIFAAGGVTPVPNLKVYLVTGCPDGGGVCVVATAITNDTGGYRMDSIPLGRYTFSAFYSGLSDGNVAQLDVKFNGQVVRNDLTFRGGGGQITGRVYDDDGVTPLKARVGISGDRVISAGGIVGLGFQYVRNYAIADTNFTTGQFSFGGVMVGEVALSAVGPFSPDPVTVSGVMPSAGASVEMNLRLQPTSVLTGIVTQPDGVTPAGPNVIVRFKSDEGRIICGETGCVRIPQGIQEEIVITDAESRYLVPLVNAGTFTLTAEDPASGRSAQVQGIVRAGETGEVPIRLTRVATVRVEVRGSDTVTPIPGARVEVAQLEYPKKKLTFIADGDGVVTFGGADGFSEGDIVVLATDLSNGFAGRAPARVTSEDDQVDVKVYLFNSTGTVEGTVFRSDGLTPVPFADVIISNCVDDGFGGCTSGGSLAFAVTDAAGHYEQNQIPEGDFTVEVFEAATARRGFQRGRIDQPGQVVGINVVEAALGQVSGALLQSGSLAPIKGGRVWLSHRAPSGRQLPTLNGTSSVDGSFAFPGVSVGTFSISARVTKPEPGGFADVSGAIVREGEVVDIPIVVNIVRPAFGTIAGIVRNPDGTPGAFSRIEICHADLDCSIPRLVTAEADGTFSLAHVPLGRFSINARSQVGTNTGSLLGELVFENEVTSLTVVLSGVRRITGTVFRSNGIDVAPLVEVVLTGLPQSGCASACTQFADQAGNFTFEGVPAETFTITARDPVTGLRGVTGGSLAPSESKIVRVVLQASGGVSGRVLFADSRPAPHVIAALTPLAPQGGFGAEPIFTETDANGHFAFVGVPVGPFRLELEDPLGSGIARRTATVAGDTLLGDIVLDEAAPTVQSMTPAASAIGVPQATTVQVVFSEPIDQGTINLQNVVFTGPSGVVTGVLAVSNNDTLVTLTPLAPLNTETRYSLRVKGVKDRLGKTMTAEFVAGFTTIDITAPAALDISPAPGTNGISVDSPFRVRFSEPIDPSRLRAPPVILSTTGGTVDGRFDLLFGNTVAVFTPLRPLSRGATYQVDLSSVTDLSGNAQPAGLIYSFSTTDGTAPEIVALSAANNGTVIEGSVATVTADVGVTHDVAIVDFYANGVLVAGDRSAPFELRLQATPAFGGPGDSITITALATDTSGNRGRTPAQVLVAIVADQPPSIAITSPASGLSARNGDRIVVTARGLDDLGLVQLGFRAQTGKPQDAANRPIVPVVIDRSEEFVFFVPQDAPPGSTIRIEASAVDTKGQVGAAPAVELVVLDAVPPTITITGLATGARVRPGQQATAIVSASDVGHIASITFGASGVTAFAQTRALDPTQPAVFASFSFAIPAGARPGEFINLDASAVDKAGNVTHAARVILPIADLTAPTVQLRTSNGRLDMVPGRQVIVIAEVEDEVGVTRVDLSGSGAFSLSDTRQISPPLGSAEATFTINVPAGIADGAVLNLQATATDIAGNVSDATILSLTATTLIDITMPPSVIVMAGETRDITVGLSAPAPAGGLRVDFASRNAGIAVVAPSVLFAEGEMSRTVAITGVAGGVVSIDALVLGVQRATMTTTVRGGIVRGQVLMVVNADLVPVPNAQVTLSDGQTNVTTTSDGSGEFLFEGYPWFGFTLRALDPVSGFRGFVTGTMSGQNGFAEVNIVLIPAGVIRGTVRQADGVTLAGAGVRVDIFAPGNFQPVGTTFTDAAGAYEFPLVGLGNYVIDATAADGNRGRASAALTTSAELDVPITYLGRGTVTITVLDGSDHPVPNAAITFTTRTVFGYQPAIRVNAEADGTIRFENVPVGDFQVEARDTVSNAAGTAAGALTSHLQDVQLVVEVGSYGALEGTVYRADGVTPVPNARVTAGGSFYGFFTTTDENGRYRFEFLRLGLMQVDASDEPTRGRGRATANLITNGATVTQDIVFVGQGTIVATVTDAVGTPVSGAIVEIRTTNPTVGGDSLYGYTGNDGTLLLEHVLVGPFTALAWSNGLFITQTGTLSQNGEVLPLLLRLQPTGTIKGTVYAPDGQTPMTSGTVYAHDATDPYFNHFFPMRQSAIGADGTYTLPDLRFYNYNVSVRDSLGRLRAITRNVVISSLGQVETRDMTFVGLGRVAGRVVFEGASAPNLPVEVRSLTPAFGGVATVQTNAGGFYQADDVVVGNISVSTGDASRQLLGEAQGRLERDGDTLTLDVLLQNNAITLPQTKYDANNNYYQVQRDARLQGSGGDLFSKTFGATQGGLVLDLVTDTATARFEGAAIGTVEELGREIVARQQSLAGLNVTRKVFLPRTGYFARYLETVSNPTAAPITVAVRVTSILPRDNYDLIRTSSGDTVLDISNAATRDRWVVFDDPAGAQHPMSAAFVFDGADGADRVGTLMLESNPDPSCFSFGICSSRRLVYTWNSVTLAPGESVTYAHFISHQIRQASALASAERLAQLPPEALAGLSAAEMTQIRNFTVPDGGNSALAALPSLFGTVTGRLLEGDGVTPVPSVVQGVRFTSNSLFYDANYLINTDGLGRFTLTSSLVDFASNVVVPAEGFTLRANRHPVTNIQGPPAAGAFAPDTLVADQDVSFSNAGLLSGVVRRQNGTPVTTGSLMAFGSGYFAQFIPIASDGSYRIGGLPAGPATVTVSIPHPQGSALSSVTVVPITAGQLTTTDLLLPPTGAVTGIVRTATGSVAPNLQVQLFGSSISRTTISDSAGLYLLSDVPAGTYQIQVREPSTNVATVVSITVPADQTTTQHLQLVGTGRVQVQAFYTGGAPFAGFVVVRDTTGAFVTSKQLDATGRATFDAVPVGGFKVTINHPLAFGATVDALGTITTHGETVPVSLTLPPVGSVRVQVNFAGGAPAANASVELQHATSFLNVVGQTNASGILVVPNVVGPAFAARARHPVDFGLSPLVSGTLTTEAQQAQVTITLPPVGNVSVQVNSTAGGALAGIRVDVQDESNTSFRFGGFTDASGLVTIPRVRAAFVVQAYDSADFRLNRFGSGRIDTEGQVVPVTIVLGASGTVTGRVLQPTGAPMLVEVLSENPSFSSQVLTDSAGQFSVPNVPVGNFRAKTSDSATGRAAWAYGSIAQHGDTATADLDLAHALLYAAFSDANGYNYAIGTGGEVTQRFIPGAFADSNTLSVGSGSTSWFMGNQSFFRGDFAATWELDRRQVSIANTAPFGGFPIAPGNLKITRKVYVPSSGYFARYLEVFENVGATALTTDTVIRGSLAYGAFAARIAATSSGDTTFDAGDRWVIVNDPASTIRPVGLLVVGGAGARKSLADAGLIDAQRDKPWMRWNGLTLAPGERLILMHFAVQQASVATAQTSAERLLQLPPEALHGLTAEERAAIVNFDVPLDGSSPVAPFATLRGRVLAGDGTPVPGAVVTVTNPGGIFSGNTVTTAGATGEYSLSTLTPGAFEARARHPLTNALTPLVSGVVGPADTIIEQDFVFAGSGSLGGIVRFASGAAAANGQVRLTRASPALDKTVTVAADGSYLFAGLDAGAYTLQATTASRSSALIAATIIAGQATTADLRLNAIAAVRIKTVQGDGVTVVPFATIRLFDSVGTLRGFTNTNAEGICTFTSLWEEAWVINALAAGLSGSASVIVGPANDGQLIDVVIAMHGPVTGNVRARVLAGDGLTPVGFAYVEVFDVATGVLLRGAYSNADGILNVSNATDSGLGIRATAYTPNFAAAVSEVVRLTTAGQTVDVNLILPLSVVRGRVFFNDGITPVPYPDAFVQQTDGFGNPLTFYANTSEADGSYTVIGAGIGALVVTAQDSDSGLTASAPGELLSVAQAAVVDLVLPPSGAVAGQVRDAAGDPVGSAWVGIVAGPSGFTQWARTDEQGNYRFERVALGPALVQACNNAFNLCSAAVELSLDNANDESIVNLTLPATGMVVGRVLAPDGSPVADADVWVVSVAYAGPVQESIQQYARTDAAGEYSVAVVPVGPVRVTANLAADFNVAGVADGTVTAGGTTTVDVTIGNAFRFGMFRLEGADGFRYDVMCAGSLSSSGSVDGTLFGGYANAYRAKVGADAFSCPMAGLLEESGRQIAIGPAPVGALMLTRKVFVPAGGGFARYLEILTNPTTSPRTATVGIDSFLGASGGAHSLVVVTAPPATNHTFAITDLTGECCDPLLAHVFGGPGAAVSAATHFAAGDNQISYRWTVDVPPGETVVLMHFTAQRNPGATAAAQAQAEALVNLTDANALAGMTAAERARVLNFVIP